MTVDVGQAGLPLEVPAVEVPDGPVMSAPYLRQKDYAAYRGVQPSAVSNWKREGLLVFCREPGHEKLVDVAATDTSLAHRKDPMRGRPTTGDGVVPAAPNGASQPEPVGETPGSMAQLRGDLLKVQTDGLRLKHSREAGELVPLIEAERRMMEFGRLAPQRVRSSLRAIAERLAVETDRRAIMALCDEVVDGCFAQMAADVEGGLLAPQGDGDEAGTDDLPTEADGEIGGAA